MHRLMLSVLLICCAPLALAQSQGPYPNRPIRVVGGFAPGGGVDIFARGVTPRMAEALGQPVVMVYQPGANGTIAANAVAKSAADGYTLFVTNISLAVFSSLIAKLPFNPETDFTAVAQLASLTSALVVHPSLPVKSVKELIALAKSQPGKLNYANAGNGTSTHLGAELFKSLAGLDIVSIPYNGAAPAVTALIGGDVQIMFATLPTALPQVKAQRMRALAVTAARRARAAADLPTINEDGLPGFDVSSWVGLVAPVNTPNAIIDKLNQAANKALAMPETQESFAREGGEAMNLSAEQFGAYIRAEFQKWAKVIRDAGIKPS